MKIFEFADSEDSGQVTHDMLPHLALHCMPSILIAWMNQFLKFEDENSIIFPCTLRVREAP